jgi:hypothetical protein
VSLRNEPLQPDLVKADVVRFDIILRFGKANDPRSWPIVFGPATSICEMTPFVITSPCNLSVLWKAGHFSMDDAKYARCGFLTYDIAVHFECRAAAAETPWPKKRKPDIHRVLKRPGEATGVVLTIAVSPHRQIEHRSQRLTVTELKRDA